MNSLGATSPSVRSNACSPTSANARKLSPRFGDNVTKAGLILLPSTVMMLLFGPVSGSLSRRFGGKLPLALGAAGCSLAFIFLAVERKLTSELKTGDFILRKSMTPDQLVTALLDPHAIQHIEIALRTGLRLEQITAKLETIDGLTMNPEDFYNLAKHPTPELLKAYDWLDLPAGASLEGYLWPATYEVLPDSSSA